MQTPAHVALASCPAVTHRKRSKGLRPAPAAVLRQNNQEVRPMADNDLAAIACEAAALPSVWADRLHGETFEELVADAQRVRGVLPGAEQGTSETPLDAL